MASEDLHVISAEWLRSLEKKIHGFLSEVVDGKPRLEHSGLRDFKLDNHTVNAPSPFKVPYLQVIKGVQGAFTFTITKPAALGRGFFRLTQDGNGNWKALTLFTNMQNLIGHEESLEDQYGLYEDRKITWEEDVNARFRAIEADPTVMIVGGGQASLMSAARLGRLGIRVLIIEKNARVGDSWRKRYPNLTLHTAAHQSSMLYNHELCIWLSSSIASTPAYDSSSARWTVEIQHGDQKVFLKPKHLILATGIGNPYIPTWNGMDKFQGALYHAEFHKDAEQFRGKRVVVVGAGNASGDMCQDFVAHGATEVTMVQRNATCVISLTVAKEISKSPFPDGTPIEELDFRRNSMPLPLILQLKISGGTQRTKLLDKELHDGLRNVGFNLTWEVSPGGGEVGLEGFVFMIDVGCGKLIAEGRIKIKQGQDISHFDRDGITFKDGSKLSADVIVLATGYESIMKTTRALLGNEITDQLPPEVWGLDSEGELNQTYRPSGHPGLWFATGGFAFSRFFSKHL
ncbi:hypothetical protein BDR07DRAFT_1403867, partial [Suillus spraguei]